MESKFFSWIKNARTKIGERKPQHITDPSAFYLIRKVDGYQGKYDGEKHSIVLVMAENCFVRYSFDGKSWSNTKPEFKDVCETECYIRVSRNKRIEETKVIIHIAPRNLILISGYACKEYDGKELENSQVIIAGDGLIEGDGLTAAAMGKRTLVGSTKNNIQYSFENEEVAKNYVVTERLGEIIIEDRKEKYSIYLHGRSGCYTYDGCKHAIDGFENNFFIIDGNHYQVLGIKTYASLSNAGEIKGECVGELRVEDESGNDVTSQFEVHIVPGTLKIEKRNIEFVSGSVEKEYDGIVLSCHEYQVNGDGLAADDKIVVSFNSEQLIVGSCENTMEVHFENGSIDNYNIKLYPGRISVSNRTKKYQIVLSGKKDSVLYDGQEHYLEGFEVYTTKVNGQLYYVDGVNSAVEGGDAGVYKGTVCGNAIVRDVYGNNVTDQFELNIIPCELEIRKRNIEIISGSVMKEYDGIVLSCGEYQIAGDGIVYGDLINVILPEKQLLVGSVENTIYYQFVNERTSGNYNVYLKAGVLSVLSRKNKLQIKLLGKSDSVEYDGYEHVVEGFESDSFEINSCYFCVKGLTATAKTFVGSVEQNISGTATVIDSFGNDVTNQFEVDVEPGVLQITDRQIPYAFTIQGKSLAEKYNGSVQILEEKIDCYMEIDLHRFHVSGLTLKATGTHVGSIQTENLGSIVVTDMYGNDVSRQFAATIIPGTLTVLPREVKIISASEAREYNGSKLESKEVRYEGDGFLPCEAPVITFEGSQCIVGKCENRFSFKMPQGVRKEDYSIQVEFGTLEVVDRKEKYRVGCHLKNVDVLYDGKMHFSPDTYEDTIEIHDIPFKVSVSYGSLFAIDAGTYPYEITDIGIFDADNNNVTTQFAVDIIPGALIVSKRALSLSSGNCEKEYDGTPLISDDVFISGDGFAEGEGLDYNFSNRQTLPGTVVNEFTYCPNSNTSIKNYDISCSFGQLTVLNRVEPICIELQGESRTYLYDEEEKELPEFENLSFECNGNLFYISGISNRITGIEEGKYSRTDIDTYRVFDAKHNDVTDQFCVVVHPGTLTIEHNAAYDLIPEKNKEQIDEYDIAVHEILEKMTGKKSSEGVKKFSRRELADRFTDNKELLKAKGTIAPKYEALLDERIEQDRLDVLRNRIAREFRDVTLLSEIEISDSEFHLLMYYFRKKYAYVKKNYRKSFVDIMFAVAMVQIGIRYYENNFWPQVCIASDLDSIGLNDRNWVGGSVTETLLAFGKPVYEKNEYVTNIMMHCFITDAFAGRFFDYLFQYYRLDLERDLSGLQDMDLEYLCKSIINPYAKRQQLLSDYMAMSIRAAREYCKGIISKSLTMIDCSFWDEEYPEDCLSGRLADRFEEWKEVSKFYKPEKRKYQNENNHRNGLRKYRKPHMLCDIDKGVFHVVLPSQMVPRIETEETPNVTWFVVSKTQKQFSCDLTEGFSGYRTKEIKFEIEPESIFDKYIFLLFADNVPLRSFVWEERKVQFFKDDGCWMSGTKLEEGRAVAFVNSSSKIDSKAILYHGYELGLSYYELNIQNGDFVCVEGVDNYYVGDIPKPGLSEVDMISGVRISMNNERNNIRVYNRYPEIVIEVEGNEYKGTAIIVNGTINKLSKVNFIDVKIGKISTKKYYFVNAGELRGSEEGYNSVIIDYPQATKSVNLEYFVIKDFQFEFQDAPYVFVNNGVLNINRNIACGTMSIANPLMMNRIDFLMSDIKDGVLTIEDNNGIKLNFDVPMLYYSWDRKEWLYAKPEDIWHSELNRIIYLKYPTDQLGLFVGGRQRDSYIIYKKKSDGIFDCDITKMLSYFSDTKIFETIVLKTNSTEAVLFRVIQKSILVNAMLQPDYGAHQIKAQLDILGKGSYYVDLYCDGEVVVEKEPVSEELKATFDIEVETADYVIKVFESADEFGFDEDYDFVGEKRIALLNPADLIGGCMKITSIVKEMDQTMFSLDNNYGYYIYLEEQYNTTKYKAILAGIFYKEDNIMYASNAIVEIPDVNNAETITIERLNESEKVEAFCYNHGKQAIVDQRYSNSNQRLMFLNKQDFSLHVEYISPNKIRKNKAIQWIKERKERSRKKFSIWKEE